MPGEGARHWAHILLMLTCGGGVGLALSKVAGKPASYTSCTGPHIHQPWDPEAGVSSRHHRSRVYLALRKLLSTCGNYCNWKKGEAGRRVVTLCDPCVQGSHLGRPYNQQGKLKLGISWEISMQMLWNKFISPATFIRNTWNFLLNGIGTCFHRVFPVLVTSECFVGGGTGNHGGAGKLSAADHCQLMAASFSVTYSSSKEG